MIEVSLIGRATSLSDKEELILIALGRHQVDLRGKVAPCIDLTVHIEGRILRKAEVVARVGVVDAVREVLLVASTSPDVLTFLTQDDGGTGVLAEGELPQSAYLSIAEEGESDELIIVRSLWVGQYRCDLLLVSGT